MKHKFHRKHLWELFLLAISIGIVCIIENILGIGCPIRHFTGIPCAGCGMTRAILSALQLNFHRAFYYHPLFWMIPLTGIFLLFREHVPAKWNRGFWYLFAFLFLGVYVVRLIMRDPVLEVNIRSGVIYRMLSFLFHFIN